MVAKSQHPIIFAVEIINLINVKKDEEEVT